MTLSNFFAKKGIRLDFISFIALQRNYDHISVHKPCCVRSTYVTTEDFQH